MPDIINGQKVFTNEEIASKILRKFDFDSVHKHMTKVRWTWAAGAGPHGIPTKLQIRQEARRLILDILEDEHHEFRDTGWTFIATGGFEVVRNSEGIDLRFIPWESSYWHE